MWATMEVMEKHKNEKNVVEEGKERLEIFKQAESAMQKQISVNIDIYAEEVLKCPKCNEELGYYTKNECLYCINCGQKIKFISKG